MLNHLDVIIGFTKTLLWKGAIPFVKQVTQIYETGKKLTAKAMHLLEQRIEREEEIGKWFVTIKPLPLVDG